MLPLWSRTADSAGPAGNGPTSSGSPVGFQRGESGPTGEADRHQPGLGRLQRCRAQCAWEGKRAREAGGSIRLSPSERIERRGAEVFAVVRRISQGAGYHTAEVVPRSD